MVLVVSAYNKMTLRQLRSKHGTCVWCRGNGAILLLHWCHLAGHSAPLPLVTLLSASITRHKDSFPPIPSPHTQIAQHPPGHLSHTQNQQFRCDQCDYTINKRRATIDISSPPATNLTHSLFETSSPASSDSFEENKQKSSQLEFGFPKPSEASNSCRIIFGRQSGASFNL